MSKVIKTVKNKQKQKPAKETCRHCNYENNYYGDQVCVDKRSN